MLFPGNDSFLAPPKTIDYDKKATIFANKRLLLFLWSFESSKFASLAVVIYYGTVRSAGKDSGKAITDKVRLSLILA
jgi:hypothetical protein